MALKELDTINPIDRSGLWGVVIGFSSNLKIIF
nr:MAG TPA: hypothetical protein [Caudoviricetes sp.]